MPATPPQNVQTSFSSAELIVTWDEIPGLDQNGIIINYDVQIESLDFSTEVLIITSNLFTHIGFSGLEVLSIRVRAHTSVGPGPYSDPVTERTFENGMYSSLSFLCGIIYITGVSTEPAAPPENVQAKAISSTTIMVTWEEVLAISQNGIIVNYEVRAEPLQFTGELEIQTMNTTDLSANITGLEENVEYNISVRAYTSMGPGPYSDPVTERTSEDGIILFLLNPMKPTGLWDLEPPLTESI